IPDEILDPIREIGGKVRARCIVKCVIERDGSISDATIFQSTSAAIFDTEALRVVSNLPKFYPASIMEVPVRSWKLIPVEFIYDFSRNN
ncbi:MAG: TonB family protein, partial [Muribaculaceae bacterium]|nr:TonB family protein [Muribaculaceae bacterium]